VLDENLSGQPQALIETLCDLVLSGPIHEEITGNRRSYTCHLAVVRHEGVLWALAWTSNEHHAYATAAYRVRPVLVTRTVYERIEGE
jgi:hypothetical protein